MYVIDHDLAYKDGKGYCPVCQLRYFRDLALTCGIISPPYNIDDAPSKLPHNPLPRSVLVAHLHQFMNSCPYHEAFAYFLQTQYGIFKGPEPHP